MKRYLLPLAVIAIILQSCAPVYNCGETPEKKLKGSKRLMYTVSERDSLCEQNELKDEKISDLNSDVMNLKASLNDQVNATKSWKTKYDALTNSSSSKQDEMSKILEEREMEIKAREKEIANMRAVLNRQDSITNRLNDILRKALLGFNSDELTVDVKNGKVYVSMSDKLMFKSASADLEQKGAEALNLLADVLVKNPDIDVQVEGHTDNIPIKTALYKDNWDLSVARAASVVRILTWSYKVNPKQVTPAGRGEYFPKGDNSTPEGRASNIRTEIILSPKLDEIMNLLNNK